MKFFNFRRRAQDLKMRRNIQQSMCYGSTVLKYGDYYENVGLCCYNVKEGKHFPFPLPVTTHFS